MRSFFLVCCLSCLLWSGLLAESVPVRAASGLPADRQAGLAVDLYCLRLGYPVIHSLEDHTDGSSFLVLKDGSRVPYTLPAGVDAPLDAVDVCASMAEVYPLEPERPAKPGTAGQLRSALLLQALYGQEPAAVAQSLQTAFVQANPVRLSLRAALALQKADAHLVLAVSRMPEIYSLLKPDRGFAWQEGGSSTPGPHAFGIAVDLSSDKAPDWRGSPQMPHPMQYTYPSAVVAAMEEQGFIWGGKWREYELMHFEYRPELIYKARILRAIEYLRQNTVTAP
ncbi:MAG: M15 family metallopeptidase [Desulfovibrio sp.]|nr:M15 family metallopeptidase [Desulfovibrio sp.]